MLKRKADKKKRGFFEFLQNVSFKQKLNASFVKMYSFYCFYMSVVPVSNEPAGLLLMVWSWDETSDFDIVLADIVPNELVHWKILKSKSFKM